MDSQVGMWSTLVILEDDTVCTEFLEYTDQDIGGTRNSKTKLLFMKNAWANNNKRSARSAKLVLNKGDVIIFNTHHIHRGPANDKDSESDTVSNLYQSHL